MEFDKIALEKLPLQERLKKLKELEEEAKKQLEETKKVLEESEDLIKISEDEITKGEIEKEIDDIRERKEIKDLSTLLRRRIDDLEGLAGQLPSGGDGMYTSQPAQADPDVAYIAGRAKEIQEAYAGNPLTYDRVKELRDMHEKMDVALEYRQLTQETERDALATKRVIEQLLGSYLADMKYTP